jgi:hypothetical protein
MAHGMSAVMMLRSNRKTSKSAAADGKNQDPGKLP